ncbi:tRNA isopentenyltransferase [Xylariomycetidae sp. FL2044]|nr:tRNA isopentenyltransferase [Xylariomycetidae sp. FL2044]
MALSLKPREPLVVVMGTTGTGKSDLAMHIAANFNGEIINADAMQIYKGLPIITNQVPPKERRSIPHHLLGTVNVLEPTWTGTLFRKEACKLIKEIRGRGKLPVVVGGSHYYIQSLLFDNIVDGTNNGDKENYRSAQDLEDRYPILNAPTDEILRHLREIDPVMADRWHPEDRRKIKRSLEIYLTTGRRASDIYAQQKQSRVTEDHLEAPWDSLVFWVHTEQETLKERLYQRVDKMAKSGLFEELSILRKRTQDLESRGEVIDYTRGIWQSIGYRQMEPYTRAEQDGNCESNDLSKLKAAGLEEMKVANRQYAKLQLRWIRSKTIPAFKDRGVMKFLFVLDSTKSEHFSQDVLEPAAHICAEFLRGGVLPDPADVSITAKEVLASFDHHDPLKRPLSRVKTCLVCNKELQTEHQWILHNQSRKHHGNVRKQKKQSLVPVHIDTSLSLVPAGSIANREREDGDGALAPNVGNANLG